MEKYESEFINALKVMEILKKCPLDVFLKVYYKVKGTPGKTVMKRQTKRITLKEVVNTMNDGFKRMDDNFKQVNTRIDNLEKDVNTRIDGLTLRIDRIETRLDYIVTTNNLKDRK